MGFNSCKFRRLCSFQVFLFCSLAMRAAQIFPKLLCVTIESFTAAFFKCRECVFCPLSWSLSGSTGENTVSWGALRAEMWCADRQQEQM